MQGEQTLLTHRLTAPEGLLGGDYAMAEAVGDHLLVVGEVVSGGGHHRGTVPAHLYGAFAALAPEVAG